MGKSTELLTERETSVLTTVLAHYIQTGEPVGSRTVAKFSGLNLSPATIRNLMLELEERGYLRQPHTSAGRVPTPLGFRYYVDRILPIQELGTGVQRQIEVAFTPSAVDPQELVRQASRALSTVSGHPALVLSPRPQGMLLRHIQFITLGGDGILCQNLTLAEARRQILAQMEEEKNLFDKMVSQALSLSRQALQSEDDEEELYIEGTSHILDYPEFSADVEKIRVIFKAFEEKHHLITLLDRTLASQGVHIIISPDEQFPEMQLSLVASSYRCDQSPVGSLGVIGPMRMDYARVVPIVNYTASLMTKWFTRRQS